jgi:LytS/YehU family sensor histidine kinase
VIDNGPGLDPNKDNNHGGIGLSNTRSRLNHLYGNSAKLQLLPLAQGGLEVHIELPFRTGTQ